MICCGKEVVTPFCPMCGKKSGDPIAGLLHHLRTTLGAYTDTHEQRKREFEAGTFPNDRTREREAERVERSERTVAKWQSWVDALEALIAKRRSKEG